VSLANVTTAELQDWNAIARQIAWGAADILMAMQNTYQIESAEGDPVTTADVAANHYILSNLHAIFGSEFGYLSEETFKSQSASDRLNQSLVWIIDPLDGTKDYMSANGEYAVHIALVQNHRPIMAVVACPVAETVYSAVLGQGTIAERKDGSTRTMQVSAHNQLTDLTVVASRSHRDQRFEQLMQQFPCQKQKQVGSIGGKIGAIVEQQADVYISLSGKSAPKDWDLAAPELILTEAGGKLTRFDGSLLLYNQADVVQWGGLLASNGHCHQALCQEATRLLELVKE
jgi:3'(2'), 5'-bisphosphate nucleotidase